MRPQVGSVWAGVVTRNQKPSLSGRPQVKQRQQVGVFSPVELDASLIHFSTRRALIVSPVMLPMSSAVVPLTTVVRIGSSSRLVECTSNVRLVRSTPSGYCYLATLPFKLWLVSL